MAVAIKTRSQKQLALSGIQADKTPALKGRLALNAQLYGSMPAKPAKAAKAPTQQALVEPSISDATAIQIKPLSVNEAWQGQRFKTRSYQDYERRALLLLPPILDIPAGDLSIILEFGFSNRASDLDNPVKPIMDILQKRYGFNDAQVVQYQLIKKIVPKGSEYIAFSIKAFYEI